MATRPAQPTRQAVPTPAAIVSLRKATAPRGTGHLSAKEARRVCQKGVPNALSKVPKYTKGTSPTHVRHWTARRRGDKTAS